MYSWSFILLYHTNRLIPNNNDQEFRVHMVPRDYNVKSRLRVLVTLCLLLQSLLQNFVTDLQRPLLGFFFFCQFVTMQLIPFRSAFARFL